MRITPAPLLRARSSRTVKSPRAAFDALPKIAAAQPEAAPGAADTPPPTLLGAEHLHLQNLVFARLDEAAALSGTHGEGAFVTAVIDVLRTLKAEAGQADWDAVILPAARRHGIAALVQECPLTQHSFRRPRGYPGDAGLLDLVYRHPDAQPAIDASTAVGRAVFDYTNAVSASEAVRQRRTILARAIDATAERRPGADILAVACGHLREAELSTALAAGQVGRFVATDQDRQSLDVVEGCARAGSSPVVTEALSVRHFIADRHDLGTFDLVYAAGLYDYLDDRIAARLTRKLFTLLKPGGRLLVGNYLTGIREMAYMEAYMDWYLLYRTETQIRAFAAEISEVDIGSVTYFLDDAACIGYLELERA